jgi:hypothetical protein
MPQYFHSTRLPTQDTTNRPWSKWNLYQYLCLSVFKCTWWYIATREDTWLPTVERFTEPDNVDISAEWATESSHGSLTQTASIIPAVIIAAVSRVKAVPRRVIYSKTSQEWGLLRSSAHDSSFLREKERWTEYSSVGPCSEMMLQATWPLWPDP